ncbi:MAG: hypothetical protein WAU07_02420, partial [Microgenomates group bacterium]
MGWFLYFLYFWVNAIKIAPDRSITVYHMSIWGDWAAHFTMGSAMAYRDLFLSTSPFLIGAPFSYPFVANMISAVLIRLGVPFFSAFVIPSFLACLFFVGALYAFYKTLFKKESIAIIASLIFLWNGGIGFVEYFADIVASDTPLQTIITPPREYTHLSKGYVIEWISIIYSMVIPQRAFTLGFPIALLILILVHRVYFSDMKSGWLSRLKKWITRDSTISGKIIKPSVVAGLLIGFMPILHSHSFLALGIIMPIWTIGSIIQRRLQKKSWKESLTPALIIAGVSGSIALPIYLIFLDQNVSHNFFQWFPGWYSKAEDISFIEFWLNNWTITPLVALLGLIIQLRDSKTAAEKTKVLTIFFPFFLLFVLLNLVLFQPFIWDNTKILTWASLGISGLAGFTVVYLWNYKNRAVGIITASCIFFILTAAGAIDAWRVIRFELHGVGMYSANDMALVDWAKNNTSKDSVWLTGDHHNHW